MEKLIEKFKSGNITASFVETRDAVLSKIIELVKEGQTVAFAGSQTVVDTGVRDYFIQHRDQYKVINPYEPGILPTEALERRRRSLLADVLITGSNAVTLSGELVNMDNQGNRVAGIAFGPNKVIIVVGKNKIVKNLAEARRRIAETAAPMNNKRLKLGNPCEISGRCENCNSPKRICRIYSVISSQSKPDRIHVIIVDEDLGY